MATYLGYIEKNKGKNKTLFNFLPFYTIDDKGIILISDDEKENQFGKFQNINIHYGIDEKKVCNERTRLEGLVDKPIIIKFDDDDIEKKEKQSPVVVYSIITFQCLSDQGFYYIFNEEYNEQINNLSSKEKVLIYEQGSIYKGIYTIANGKLTGNEEEKVYQVNDSDIYRISIKDADNTKFVYQFARSINELEKNTDEKETLKSEITRLEERQEELKKINENIEDTIKSTIENITELMTKQTVDGFVASKMLEEAANWNKSRNSACYQEIANQTKNFANKELELNLVEYIYNLIHSVRSGYDKNTIINLAICFTQGFITVLSGKPGCGKTSICNIFAEILGLNKINDFIEGNANRFVSISVERGWTSKRDLIGYYNPLTKSFDKSSKEFYDLLKIMKEENKGDCDNKLPIYVLLDEANLSPMEYYWADFMNLCDGNLENKSINLGDDEIYKFNDNFHFMATINNDHTTENLSPRLVDRAWVITLPEVENDYNDDQLNKDDIKIIPWHCMKKTFDKDIDRENVTNITESLKTIIDKFKEMKNPVSPRTYNSIIRYCNTGIGLFEQDNKDNVERESSTIALDYAVAQKLLPKISGYGEKYERKLKKLLEYFEDNQLTYSHKLLKDIIDRGGEQMDYYQFFD